MCAVGSASFPLWWVVSFTDIAAVGARYPRIGGLLRVRGYRLWERWEGGKRCYYQSAVMTRQWPPRKQLKSTSIYGVRVPEARESRNPVISNLVYLVTEKRQTLLVLSSRGPRDPDPARLIFPFPRHLTYRNRFGFTSQQCAEGAPPANSSLGEPHPPLPYRIRLAAQFTN